MENNTTNTPGLIELLDTWFDEYDNDITMTLRETNKVYDALRCQMSEMSEKYPFIAAVFDFPGAVSMSVEEHAIFDKYLDLQNECMCIERQNLYYAGHKDCLAYLRRINAL